MPRGQTYKQRRAAAAAYLVTELPQLEIKQIARREGLSESTVRQIAKELGVDLALYTRRRKLVLKYKELLTQQETLLTQIEAPIYKKEQ